MHNYEGHCQPSFGLIFLLRCHQHPKPLDFRDSTLLSSSSFPPYFHWLVLHFHRLFFPWAVKFLIYRVPFLILFHSYSTCSPWVLIFTQPTILLRNLIIILVALIYFTSNSIPAFMQVLLILLKNLSKPASTSTRVFSHDSLSSWTPSPLTLTPSFSFKNQFRCYHLNENFHRFLKHNDLSLPPTFQSSSLNILVIWFGCIFFLFCLSFSLKGKFLRGKNNFLHIFVSPLLGTTWHRTRNNYIDIITWHIMPLYQTNTDFLCHAWRNWSREQ